MSNNDEVTKDELGAAKDITMDKFLRKMVAQMYENDNDVSVLEVVLEAADGTLPPSTLQLQLKLLSINGIATKKDINNA